MNATSEKDKTQKPILSSFKNFLTKFSPKEQMEMSIFTLTGLIIMLALTTIYLAFFQDLTTFFTVLIVINGIFGIGFLFSMLLTTYSQYITLLSIGNAQDIMKSLKAVEGLVS